MWLEEGGYSFRMHDVDRDDAAAEVLADINPRGAVPTFDVGGVVVQGFRARHLESVIRRVAQERLQVARRSGP